MKKTTSTISVKIDDHDKEVANAILKNLGLNMSTYVNMAIKQLINKNGIPFDISVSYSDELEKSLKESVTIENEYKDGKRKGYNNTNEMLSSILDD